MTAQLRQMRAEDIEDGLRLCRAAGWNQTESDWRWFLEWNPAGCCVAAAGEAVVGTVATLPFEKRFGWVSMLLVDPAERGRGIGSALLREALRLLEDVETVRLDATPAGQAVYEKFGFEREYALLRMRTCAGAAVAEGAPDVRPMGAADLPRVLEFDRAVFGADRGALLRHLHESAPEYAFVAESGGYSFGRRGYRAEHVGPVVAADEAGARGLVAACLARHAGRRFSIDARRSTSWTPWLEGLGFTAERPFVRMFRGSHAWPGMPERQFAITGPEFG